LLTSSFDWDGVNLKRVLSLALFFFKSFFILKKLKPDIIHSHACDLGFFIALWAKIWRIPVIQTCHSITFPHPHLAVVKRYSEWFFLRFGLFDKIITIDYNLLPLFKKYKLRNFEYFNIAGVDYEQFGEAKNNLCLSKNGGVKFIYVGRIEPLKGLDYLLRAVTVLKERNLKFELWIVGDGPSRKDLEELSCRLGLEGYVKFFGAVDERGKLIQTYCLADVFVLPSLLEGLPLTVLEAWAAGLAVISTRIGMLSHIGKDGDNIMFVPFRDEGALAKAMAQAAENSVLRENLGVSGRKLAAERYSWPAVAKQLELKYITLLNPENA